MKKVLIGLVVIVVLLVGGGIILFSKMDSLLKSTIETAGTNAIGSEVKVASVELDLFAGKASIKGFSIANPEGFSDAVMVSFEELSVAIDLDSLAEGSVTRIDSIVARNPYVRFEEIDGRSNIDAVSERFASDEPAPQSTDSGPMPKLAIGNILIEKIQATIESNRLAEPVEVDLGDIVLEDLEGTPDEIAQQIMVPVMSQLSSTIGLAVLTSLSGLSSEDISAQVDELQGQAEEELDELEDDLNNRLDEALGEDVREGLGNLLNR